MKEKIDFPMERYCFECRFQTSVRIGNHPEILVRRWLDGYLKRMVCRQERRQCEACHLASTCLYFQMFETSALSPFVLYVRSERDVMTDRLQFELTLFGKFRSSILPIIATVDLAGRNGHSVDKKNRVSFAVHQVERFDSNQWTPYYTENRLIDEPSPANQGCRLSSSAHRDWILRFQTPLVLRSKSLTLSGEFFAELLSRRIGQALDQFSGEGAKPTVNFNREIHTAIGESDFSVLGSEERRIRYYSYRLKKTLYFNGWIATIRVTDAMDSLKNWLDLGSVLHLGKQVSFGLGKYELASLEAS